MTRRVLWSRRARADCTALLEYISNRDVRAAELAQDRIDEAATQLSVASTGRPGRVAETYEKSVAGTSHIIAYELVAGANDVVIVRLIHTAREWRKGSRPQDK